MKISALLMTVVGITPILLIALDQTVYSFVPEEFYKAIPDGKSALCGFAIIFFELIGLWGFIDLFSKDVPKPTNADLNKIAKHTNAFREMRSEEENKRLKTKKFYALLPEQHLRKVG